MTAPTPGQADEPFTMADFDAEVRRRWIESSDRLGLDHGMPNAAAALAAQDTRPASSAGPRDEALDVARGKLRRIAMGWERDPSVGADEALVMIRELLEQPQSAPELAEVFRNLAAELDAEADNLGGGVGFVTRHEIAKRIRNRLAPKPSASTALPTQENQ